MHDCNIHTHTHTHWAWVSMVPFEFSEQCQGRLRSKKKQWRVQLTRPVPSELKRSACVPVYFDVSVNRRTTSGTGSGDSEEALSPAPPESALAIVDSFPARESMSHMGKVSASLLDRIIRLASIFLNRNASVESHTAPYLSMLSFTREHENSKRPNTIFSCLVLCRVLK